MILPFWDPVSNKIDNAFIFSRPKKNVKNIGEDFDIRPQSRPQRIDWASFYLFQPAIFEQKPKTQQKNISFLLFCDSKSGHLNFSSFVRIFSDLNKINIWLFCSFSQRSIHLEYPMIVRTNFQIWTTTLLGHSEKTIHQNYTKTWYKTMIKD